MRAAGLLLALATVAAASWLGDEYWTLIGPNGKPIQGDVANFARVAHYFKPDEHNRFVAFWMTNTHYAGRMFEQFGEAYFKEGQDKYCASFTGERSEAVEVCENFRILTVPERFRGRTIFEWVKIDSIDGLEADKIGYNDHRICAFAYDPNETTTGVKYNDFTFGDAEPSKNVANAVRSVGRTSSSFDNYLLRLLVGENPTQQNIPRLPAPPAHEHHVAHRQHVDRQPNVQAQQHQQQQNQQHAQEQQAQQDAEYQRRLAQYNERLRQQQAQQQPQRDPQRDHNTQQQVQHQSQTSDKQFICDVHGRVFELKTGEDGNTRFVSYDVASHGGVRPPCTLIGETPGQSVRQEGRVEQQRPYPVRRSCSGSRKKKDAEDDC